MCTSRAAVLVADVTACHRLSSTLNAHYCSADRAYQFLNLLAELLVSRHLFVSIKMGAKLTESSYWNCFSRWFPPRRDVGGTQPVLWKRGTFQESKTPRPAQLDLEDFPLENKL